MSLLFVNLPWLAFIKSVTKKNLGIQNKHSNCQLCVPFNKIAFFLILKNCIIIHLLDINFVNVLDDIKMIITKSAIGRCKCGIGMIRCQTPMLKSCQVSFISSKPPPPPNETDPDPKRSSPLNPDQLKLISERSSQLAETLKVKYRDTLKQGTIWYQEQLNSLSQRKNGIGGGEW